MARPEALKTPLGERIRGLRGDSDRDKWAYELGVSKSTIANYERGDRSPDAAFLGKLAERGVDLNWLMTGASADRGVVVSSSSLATGFVPIQRLEIRASAGQGLVATPEDIYGEPEIIAFRESWLRRLGISPANAQFLIADGDSMTDTITHGDLLLIDRAIDRVKSEGIYVLVYMGEVKVKRVQVMRSGTVLLKSDNPRYETEEVPEHEVPDIIVEGRVRWVGGEI